MTFEERRLKLVQFNTDWKYPGELEFLRRTLDIRQGESVLDYGCGLGTAVKYLKEHTLGEIAGYDIENYPGGHPDWFRDRPEGPFDKVYLMHSIGTFETVVPELLRINSLLRPGGKVLVITPNKDFITRFRYETPKGFIVDKDVLRHFTSDCLEFALKDCGFVVERIGAFGQRHVDGIFERLFIEARTDGQIP